MRIPAPAKSILLSLALVIGFEPSTYTVLESVGDAELEVVIISGSLETDIVVRLTTADDSAVCKFSSQPIKVIHHVIDISVKLLMTM